MACCDIQSLADAIFRAALGHNVFSNTFLDLARRGRLFGWVKDLLLALAGGGRQSVGRAAQNLLAMGATSGADLATGFFFTIRRFSVQSKVIAAAQH